MTSIGFPTMSLLPLAFFQTETLSVIYVSTFSLWDDDLVNGILFLVSSTTIGEGKCNFLPFLAVYLANEGTSSSLGVG
jgi:hypothetical protein